MTTYNAIIRLRIDTEANWTASNRVLEAGEIGLISSGAHANMLKVGNGLSSWSALPFVKGDTEQISAQVYLLQNSVSNLTLNKLDEKPDATNSLIGSDGKINPLYLPDSIVGQMVYGGVFNVNGIINASSYAPVLDGSLINTIKTEHYPGYYFIAQGNYTFAGLAFSNGDWAVCQGNHSPAWMKIDNSDDVSSVNGKKGAVVITKADLGLGNVDNTADINKPVSTAQQMAINTAVAAETQARNAADTALGDMIYTLKDELEAISPELIATENSDYIATQQGDSMYLENYYD
jgi:hypothetical protein